MGCRSCCARVAHDSHRKKGDGRTRPLIRPTRTDLAAGRRAPEIRRHQVQIRRPVERRQQVRAHSEARKLTFQSFSRDVVVQTRVSSSVRNTPPMVTAVVNVARLLAASKPGCAATVTVS